MLLGVRPDLHGRVVFLALAYGSRERLPEYLAYRAEAEHLVESINARYGTDDWDPIVLEVEDDFVSSVAALTRYDVLLVNPTRDGMNLVAKEYVMTRSDLTGKLILSEFAGAATELRGAYMVNPHDTDGIKESILLAMNAGPKETRDRMSRMRRMIFRRNVYDWAKAFLAALALTSS